MKINRKRWLIAVVVTIAAGVILGISWVQRMARKSWAEQAISEITRLADDSDWVSKEISMLNNPTLGENERILADKWLSDRMVLMADGEWLVYKSHCHKAEPHNVTDIFVAKGSDGKWYYSTFHFCVHMVVIMDERQPESLAQFAADHFLREFDGRANACLQKTWPLELR